MLDTRIFNEFIKKANHAHQLFCVWIYTNIEFGKHQAEWNKIPEPGSFSPEEFSKKKGCKYKNFWDVVIPSLQHSWILQIARLFDPPYHVADKEKKKPRLCLQYILQLLDNPTLVNSIKNKINPYKQMIESIRKIRHDFLAHNDLSPNNVKIEAKVKELFEELNNIISDIKYRNPHLNSCNNLELKYTETLSRCGVDEIFEALLKK